MLDRNALAASGLVGVVLLCSVGCSDSAPSNTAKKSGPAEAAPAPSVEQPAPQKVVHTKKAVSASKKVAWTTISEKGDATAAVRKSAKTAKGVPVVYVGATWCGPCKVYKASLDDPRMVQAHRPVHIIELDADKHTEALSAVGIQPNGVPHWEMVDPSGKSVGKHIDGGAWGDNTVENMAPVLTKFFTGG